MFYGDKNNVFQGDEFEFLVQLTAPSSGSLSFSLDIQVKKREHFLF